MRWQHNVMELTASQRSHFSFFFIFSSENDEKTMQQILMCGFLNKLTHIWAAFPHCRWSCCGIGSSILANITHSGQFISLCCPCFPGAETSDKLFLLLASSHRLKLAQWWMSNLQGTMVESNEADGISSSSQLLTFCNYIRAALGISFLPLNS